MTRPRPARALAAALVLLVAAPAAEGRRARPLGVYVPAFFRRLPPAQLADDVREPLAVAGRLRTIDLKGLPDELVVTVAGDHLVLTRTHAGVTSPPAHGTLRGARLEAGPLSGRFVVAPYEVVRREPGGAERANLLCRAGLLVDGYPQLFQREEAPRPCPDAVARKVAQKLLVASRFLVEGRWAVVLAAAPVRSRPLPDAATLAEVRPGDDVDVIDTLDGWLLVHGGGVEGFVPRAAIAP